MYLLKNPYDSTLDQNHLYGVAFNLYDEGSPELIMRHIDSIHY